MEEPSQVKAYAEADFTIPHNAFVERLAQFIGTPDFNGAALELGCGPGDISLRFAQVFPQCRVDAVDGSWPMIAYARSQTSLLHRRIRFIHGRLPFVTLPKQSYDIIFSNSLLHHLSDPSILWQTIKHYAVQGTRIAVMDLLRPNSVGEAERLVTTHAASEPEILQHDFFHSLLAAFTLPEIEDQLLTAGLDFQIEQISDRHALILGIAD